MNHQTIKICYLNGKNKHQNFYVKFDTSERPNRFCQFKRHVLNQHPSIDYSNVNIYWIDDDNDEISMTCEEHFSVYLEDGKGRKLYFLIQEQEKTKLNTEEMRIRNAVNKCLETSELINKAVDNVYALIPQLLNQLNEIVNSSQFKPSSVLNSPEIINNNNNNAVSTMIDDDSVKSEPTIIELNSSQSSFEEINSIVSENLMIEENVPKIISCESPIKDYDVVSDYPVITSVLEEEDESILPKVVSVKNNLKQTSFDARLAPYSRVKVLKQATGQEFFDPYVRTVRTVKRYENPSKPDKEQQSSALKEKCPESTLAEQLSPRSSRKNDDEFKKKYKLVPIFDPTLYDKKSLQNPNIELPQYYEKIWEDE